jgi:hypothetical protein
MGDAGTEHPTDSKQKTHGSGKSGAQSGARPELSTISGDPDLARVVKAWPSLTPAQRRVIVALLDQPK